jgi:unsaturated rhamnogalacturonyl hydrolase
VHGGFTNNVWVDTSYFTSAVLARCFGVTRRRRYAAEAIRQCLNHARYLRDETTRCFVHDIDLERHVRSKWLWGRGNGFIFLALADTLAACPPATEGYDQLLQIYRELAGGLIRFQHPSGLWRIIIDDPYSHLETSGSSMILSGLAIGTRHCWLEEGLLDVVLQGFQELLSWICPEDGPLQGAFMGSERPAGPGGWEHHKYIELGECRYATGMFLRLLAEIRRLGITVQF